MDPLEKVVVEHPGPFDEAGEPPALRQPVGGEREAKGPELQRLWDCCRLAADAQVEVRRTRPMAGELRPGRGRGMETVRGADKKPNDALYGSREEGGEPFSYLRRA